MKFFTKSNDSGTSLGVAERLCYGSGGFGTGIVSGLISAFLLYFYTDYLGLNAGIIGVLFAIVRVSDGFSDLIMGRIVDRTHSKKGKAKIWMLRMCWPYILSVVLLFLVPSGATAVIQYIYVFVTYVLASAVLGTSVSVPYVTMASLLTDNPYERGLLGIYQQFSATFAGMLVSASCVALVTLLGDNQQAWVLASAVYGVIGIIFILICYFGTTERVKPSSTAKDKKGVQKQNVSTKDSIIALFKNKYWVMFIIVSILLWLITGLQSTSMIYYCDSVIQNDNVHIMV